MSIFIIQVCYLLSRLKTGRRRVWGCFVTGISVVEILLKFCWNFLFCILVNSFGFLTFSSLSFNSVMWMILFMQYDYHLITRSQHGNSAYFQFYFCLILHLFFPSKISFRVTKHCHIDKTISEILLTTFLSQNNTRNALFPISNWLVPFECFSSLFLHFFFIFPISCLHYDPHFVSTIPFPSPS